MDDKVESIIDSAASYHGYIDLKEEQKSIIKHFIHGQDVFGCLPTGFGKSVCFLLLPYIFDNLRSKPIGTSQILVIAPLTSLMKDQVDSCSSRGICGISVTKENDNRANYEQILSGQYQVVYMSPEMAIGTQKWRSAMQNDKFSSRLCGLIIDEAHCVRKWLVLPMDYQVLNVILYVRS